MAQLRSQPVTDATHSMNIFKGSCGVGTNIPPPFYIAAAQTMGGYSTGLTGECGASIARRYASGCRPDHSCQALTLSLVQARPVPFFPFFL